MKRIFIYVIIGLSTWVFLAQCVLMQNRISDTAAYRIFSAKNVSLKIYDTLIDNRHIHYAVSGNPDLPTLVFIHGSPGSWMNYMKFMWDADILKKFRIVSIDRPGFGHSDFGKALHLQDQSHLILPVLQSLKNKHPMFLCGHSMGGLIAVQLAASEPVLFEKIVIIAGALDVNLEDKETWRRIMGLKPLYWFLPGAFGPSNTELLYLKRDLIPLQEEFKKITCKVHFVHGNEDGWVPIENIAFGNKALVNARSVTADTIFGAGHNIPWKNSLELKEILLNIN